MKGYFKPVKKKRILFLNECYDIDLSFDEEHVDDFKEMWECGISLINIAKRLKREHVEIALLIIDLELCDELEPRPTGIHGL